MKICYDEKGNAIYLRLFKNNIVDSQEVEKGIVPDFNDKNQVVGIEILGVNERIPVEQLKPFQFEIA